MNNQQIQEVETHKNLGFVFSKKRKKKQKQTNKKKRDVT